MNEKIGIYENCVEVAKLLSNTDLSTTTLSSLERNEHNFRDIEFCFEKVTSKAWTKSTLCRFFSCYRDTHLTMTSVSAMMCKMLEMSEKEESSEKREYYRKATLGLSRITADDLGLSHEPHSELYDRMATSIIKSDEWKLSQYKSIPTNKMREWVYNTRVRESDLLLGLLSSLAAEIYNHGELSFLNTIFPDWISKYYSGSVKETSKINAYISVHANGIEIEHFDAAFDAVQYFCMAKQQAVDYSIIEESFNEYFTRIGSCFKDLSNLIV